MTPFQARRALSQPLPVGHQTADLDAHLAEAMETLRGLSSSEACEFVCAVTEDFHRGTLPSEDAKTRKALNLDYTR